MYYGLSQLRIDTMDVFSYFNNLLITAMAKSVKTSLEKLRIRANFSKYAIVNKNIQI